MSIIWNARRGRPRTVVYMGDAGMHLSVLLHAVARRSFSDTLNARDGARSGLPSGQGSGEFHRKSCTNNITMATPTGCLP